VIKCKNYIGIIYAIILEVLFVVISVAVSKYLNGARWYLFSSFLRIIFGILTIVLLNKMYQRSLREIFSNKMWKTALWAGSGFLLYALYVLCAIIFGYIADGPKIVGLTVSLFVTQIILQQITTGFWEEGLFRGLVLEGYFNCEKKKTYTRLLYAMMSFLMFAAIHMVGGFDIYSFFYTGTIGFAFATIYLKSHNIILPMILHFLYDIPMNLVKYMEFNNSKLFVTWYSANEVMIGIMFVVSFVILVYDKKEKQK